MVEVPNFMASDPDNVEAIVRLHGNGNTLLLKGRPNDELPRELLPCFRYSIIDLADERRIGPAGGAAGGSDANDPARPVGSADDRSTWRRRSRAARTPSSAGRSTTRSTPPRRAPARGWRSPTCRSSSS
jgi:hypothetical protein